MNAAAEADLSEAESDDEGPIEMEWDMTDGKKPNPIKDIKDDSQASLFEEE